MRRGDILDHPTITHTQAPIFLLTPTMTAESSAQKVFSTFELLKMICEFSEISDNSRIARISRLGFDAAAPQIWKALDGLQPLLALLAPRVTVYGTVFKVTASSNILFTPANV